MKTLAPTLLFLFIVSCSSYKSKHIATFNYLAQEMFFYQSIYNDEIKTDFLIKSKELTLQKPDFTSFEALFFLNVLRKKRIQSDEEFRNMLQNSKVIHSIEFITGTNTIYAYYWNERNDVYAYESKKYGGNGFQSMEITNIAPKYLHIKQKMNKGEIDEALNFLKEINFSKRGYIYILSSYKIQGTKIQEKAFSIY